MTGITVRPAAPADVTRMSKLWYERMVLLLQTDRHFTMLPDAQSKWMQTMLTWLTHNEHAVYVGDTGHDVMGYIMARKQANVLGLAPIFYGVVDELVIEIHAAYPGAAKKLLAVVEQWFRTQQIEHYVVTVSRYHAVEQAFWHTFRPARHTEDLWIRL